MLSKSSIENDIFLEFQYDFSLVQRDKLRSSLKNPVYVLQFSWHAELMFSFIKNEKQKTLQVATEQR